MNKEKCVYQVVWYNKKTGRDRFYEEQLFESYEEAETYAGIELTQIETNNKIYTIKSYKLMEKNK